jgi:hypothetical protein
LIFWWLNLTVGQVAGREKTEVRTIYVIAGALIVCALFLSLCAVLGWLIDDAERSRKEP